MKKSFLSKLNTWVNERFPLAKFLAWSLHEEIPGGASFSYTLGSAALFLFMIQVLTGLWQLFYYVPTVDHAYESLTYLRREVPFGWLIHGLHYWGATAFTVVVGLHVMRVFIWGAYKKPREMVWLAGVSLLFLTAIFMLTGPILPWDKSGYWAAKVGLNIAASTPLIGSLIQAFLQGSAQVGQVTLSRIFLIHVALLPIIMALMVMVHLIAFRQFGSTGPWNEQKRKKTGYFWPDQIFKDVLVAFFILLLLIGLSAFSPASYTGISDPTDVTYAPKPEWNFLFIYQSLKPFKGQWERIGTLGIPMTILLILLSLPFIDRDEKRNPLQRIFVMSCGAIFVGFILWMTYTGFTMNADGVIQGQSSFYQQSSSQLTLLPLDSKDVEQRQSIAQGRKLFYQDCSECHTINGKQNGLQGPDLLMVLSKTPAPTRDWIKRQLISPQQHFAFTPMPSFNYLGEKDITSLLDFLQALSLKEPMVINPIPKKLSEDGHLESYKAGKELFRTIGCAGCHTVTGQSMDTLGPDLVQALSVRRPDRQWLKDQMVSPNEHFSNSIMPSYGYLHKDQITALMDYLETLEVKSYSPSSVQKVLSQEKQNENFQQYNGPLAQEDITPANRIVGEWEHGQVLYKQYCMICHNPDRKNIPSLTPIRRDLYRDNADDFVQQIDPIIQNGSPRTGMPAFKDPQMLAQAQIADIEAYILHVNGVDRTQIINPGIKPKKFFYMIGVIFIVMSVCIGFFCWVFSMLRR